MYYMRTHMPPQKDQTYAEQSKSIKPHHLKFLAGSCRGQANPPLLFSTVKQLEAHKLLTSWGKSVLAGVLFLLTLYLASAHRPPPVCSTWQPSLPAFTPPLTSTHMGECTLLCALMQTCSCTTASCSDGTIKQEQAGVNEWIIYVQMHKAAVQLFSCCSKLSVCADCCCAALISCKTFLWITDNAEWVCVCVCVFVCQSVALPAWQWPTALVSWAPAALDGSTVQGKAFDNKKENKVTNRKVHETPAE